MAQNPAAVPNVAWVGAELRCPPGAGIEAERVTLSIAQALCPVNHHDAIGLSFSDGIDRTGQGAGRVSAVIAR